MDAQTKHCPNCAKQISLTAKFCPFCGNRIEVSNVLESEPAPPPRQESRSSAPNQPGPSYQIPPSPQQPLPKLAVAPPPPKKKRRTIVWLLYFIVLCAGAGYLMNHFFNSMKSSTTPTKVEVEEEVKITSKTRATRIPTQTPQPTRTATPTITPTPTIVLHPADNPGTGCFKTWEGMTCLDSAGWYSFPRNDPELQADNPGMELCSDGSILFNYGSKMVFFDGKDTLTLDESSRYYSGDVGCGSPRDIWLATKDAMSHYDGKTWSVFAASDLPAGMKNEDYTNSVVDLTLTPSGDLFVIQRKTITRFDGASWKIINEGESFIGAAVDSQGQVWVSHSAGLLQFKGGNWEDHPYSKSSIDTSPVIDPSNRVWVGGSGGLLIFDPKSGWSVQKIDGKTPVDKDVNSLAIDAAGRMWIGTDYGLAIYDGKKWQAYHMHTADLKSNYIEAMIIYGNLASPEPLIKPTGSLSGRLYSNSGTSTAGLSVEICVTTLGFLYIGRTPCTGQPFMRSVTTASDGRFVFSDLPTGYYVITFKIGGKWKYMTSGYGASARFLVDPGKNNQMEDILIDK